MGRVLSLRVLVIRHHVEDSAGFIGEALRCRGAELTTHLYPEQGPLPSAEDTDHVVVLGAVASIYDDGPAGRWIGQELTWLRRVHALNVPIFGVCFGAQALCVVSGGRVEAAARKEIGWALIDSLEPSMIPAGPWLQFHGDRCVPPCEARVLARNEVGVQAFSVGQHLAVQFHPEVNGAQFRRWIEGGAREEILQAGQDPDELLARTIAEEPNALERADVLVATAMSLAATMTLATDAITLEIGDAP